MVRAVRAEALALETVDTWERHGTDDVSHEQVFNCVSIILCPPLS